MYSQLSAPTVGYSSDEIDRFADHALRLKGDERIYALWRVLYAYENDQNEEGLIKWRDRIYTLAHQEKDKTLEQLASFMYQAYLNETHEFSSFTEDDWNANLAIADKAMHNIVMVEKLHQLHHFNQWADVVDVGNDLKIKLEAEGHPAEPLLIVTYQIVSDVDIQIGDYDAYFDHQLAIAQLSRNSAFLSQKMGVIYDLAFEAARENDFVAAEKFQRLLGSNIRKYDLKDLVTWNEFLCATVEDGAQDYHGVIACLKDAAGLRGAVTNSLDAYKLKMLTNAYLHLYDTRQANIYLARLRAVPPSLLAPDKSFDGMATAYLLQGDGRSSEAFEHLGTWAHAVGEDDKRTSALLLQGMYRVLRKELDRKTAESQLLKQQVAMSNWLFGAAGLIALLLAVIVVGGALWVMRMRRMQWRLKEANEHAEAANEAKTRFLAVMSHELRTPLNGVLGMAQTLQKSDMGPQQKEQIGILVDSGKTLLTLLNDVLDMSRIEAGKVELAPTPSSLKQMIERVIHTCANLAQGKQVVLNYQIDETAAQPMTFDILRVYQCLSNLVSNALKFTEVGSVSILASAEKRGHGYMVRVEVKDTGIGMSKATLEKLFEAFSQADAMTTRKYGGTGLGLNISRRLAELMGGALSVTSEEGVGSSFVMTFETGEIIAPAQEIETVQPEAEPEDKPSAMIGRKILLVDDHPVNRRVVRLFLEPFDFVITEAVDGQEALDLDMSKFDLVLMDLNMPRMGGLDATRAYRAQEVPGRHVPIIALTADAMKDQIEACYAAGMDAHISKPILMDKLIETVATLLEGSEEDAIAQARPRAAAAR